MPHTSHFLFHLCLLDSFRNRVYAISRFANAGCPCMMYMYRPDHNLYLSGRSEQLMTHPLGEGMIPILPQPRPPLQPHPLPQGRNGALTLYLQRSTPPTSYPRVIQTSSKTAATRPSFTVRGYSET